MTTEPPQITLKMEDLLNALEPLIRRVVREELTTVRQNVVNTFYLEPDSPLYLDLEEISQRKAEGKITLLSDEEVWAPSTAVYESLFKQNLRRYASLRKQIKSRVNRVLAE